MNTLTNTFNSLALKLGQSFGNSSATKLAGTVVSSTLFKVLLVIMLPLGLAMFVVSFVTRRLMAVGRIVHSALLRVVAEAVLTVLALVSLLFLGYAGWKTYDQFQERHILIAAGSQKTDSYKLAQALKTLTARHSPRIKISILELEAAPGDTGILEKGVVQLALVPANLPVGSSARSVAALTTSPQRMLLVRKDVDEQVVYTLTEALAQLSLDTSNAAQAGKTETQAPAIKAQKPDVKAISDVPLHKGSVAFYERDKTWFVVRHATLIAFVFVGLALAGLWIWQLRLRGRRNQTIEQVVEPIQFAPSTEREPWTFSKILLESVAESQASPIRR